MPLMTEGFFFRATFIALFTLLTLIRGYYKLRARVFLEKPFSGGEGFQIMASYAAMSIPLIIMTYWYIVSLEKTISTSIAFPVWLRLFGIVLGVVALMLLVWVHQSLGENFRTTIALKKNHKLVTWGPYGYVRHPMYSTYVMILVSALLMSRNLVIGGSGLAIIVFLMTVRLRLEEALLIERFGDRYRLYLQRTSKFFPRLARKRE